MPPGSTMEDRRLTGIVVSASRALAAGGLADLVWGHVSVRDPSDRGVWVKTFGPGLDEVSTDDVVLVSPTGQILVGRKSAPLEWPLHTEVAALRPDVNSVVHVHSAAVNALTSTGQPIRPISHEGTLFAFPDVPTFEETGSLITTRPLGSRLAEMLAGSRACLMPRHGAVTVGQDVAEAVVTAVLLDRACSTQLAAMTTGFMLSWSSPAETAEKRSLLATQKQFDAVYHLLARKAGVRPHLLKPSG